MIPPEVVHVSRSLRRRICGKAPVSLGTLFLATQFADLLWPLLVLGGVERFSIEPGNTRVTPLSFEYYPWSHSLVMLVVWGALFGGVYAMARRSRRDAALVVGLAVVSHWVLDLVVHEPDLPVVPGVGLRLGLGLWNSVGATLALELGFFAVGLAIYIRSTVPRNRTGTWTLVILAVFLIAIQLANIFGPPPADTTSVAIAAQAMWLLVAWGYWIDRNRRPRNS